ncbi:right-handed parallel beta-helix repeat-containing protein [candidate division KSB1 bacterium]|nr:right-handed parallel beta-helix repeat-containing protein [candidate division KSB1 bacterium]
MQVILQWPRSFIVAVKITSLLLFMMVLPATERTTAITHFVVSNTQDPGLGSLRQAIFDANHQSGPKTIIFNIPFSDPGYSSSAGVWTIQPQSALPALVSDIFLDGASQKVFIGGDPNPKGPEIEIDGYNVLSGWAGIEIGGSQNVISHLVINNFNGEQILINGDHNQVIGCYIGTDATGESRRPRSKEGVKLQSGSMNIIGGLKPEERNIISGNNSFGIEILDSRYSQILGNYIGLNAEGTDTLGNSIGIRSLSEQAVIGSQNVISGNGHGVILQSTFADSNKVIGNFIGTDIKGKKSLGNSLYGLSIQGGASNNMIGGPAPEERNIISGNNMGGIVISGIINMSSHDNQIMGNYIGTDVSGTKALPNRHDGIYLNEHAKHNMIGGGNSGEGNLISANYYNGIQIMRMGADSNIVIGNLIGTDVTGIAELGNEMAGIQIRLGAQNNTVGPDNVIAFNHTYGVSISGSSTTGNTVTHNSVHSNGDKGIYVYDGGNNSITAPVFLGSQPITGQTIADGTVEIFSTLDDEGMHYEATVKADASGIFSWEGTPAGPFVTATVTDEAGNTSEFSIGIKPSEVPSSAFCIPPSFVLHQNYPNPFNAETQIHFELPNHCRVRLAVYDLLGHEVAELVNENKLPGINKAAFDAGELPSGIYLYRLMATGKDGISHQLTRKLMMIK